MTNDNNDTAAKASIGEVSGCADRVDAQVREVLGRVLPQRRSVATAFSYLAGLAPGVRANCWALAEAAGHQGPYRMQALLGSYRWDWEKLRAELPGLAQAWLPCDEDDLIGPGLAFDETAQLKDGDVCVPKTSSTSSDQAVFVDQATDAGLPSNAVPAEIDWFG